MVAEASSDSAWPSAPVSSSLRMSAIASRSNSLRRTARSAATASDCAAWRPVAARISARIASPVRGVRPSVSLSQAALCGFRSSRSTAYRLEASTLAKFSAVLPSSRSARKYHGEVPRASETCRKASRPWSGFGPAVNQPSIAGSSCRWISACRLIPVDSASMCRSAARGSP